jgi:hypothetical protein
VDLGWLWCELIGKIRAKPVPKAERIHKFELFENAHAAQKMTRIC